MQCVIHIFIVAISVFLFIKFPFSLGGSFVFSFLIGCFALIVLKYSNMANLLLIITWNLCGLLGLNFMSYWENMEGISLVYIILLVLLIIVIVFAFSFAVFRPLKAKNQLNEAEIINFNKLNDVVLSLLVITELPLIIGIFIIMDVSHDFLNPSNEVTFLRAYLVAASVLMLGFIIAKLFMYKIEDSDIKELLSENKADFKGLDRGVVRKWCLMVIALIIIFGSGFEMLRGMWFMWISTVIMLILMSSIFWRILKLKFDE